MVWNKSKDTEETVCRNKENVSGDDKNEEIVHKDYFTLHVMTLTIIDIIIKKREKNPSVDSGNNTMSNSLISYICLYQIIH